MIFYAAFSHTISSFLSLCFYKSVSSFKGEGNGNPLQYSCLENPMEGGAFPGVTKSRTQLSNFTFTFHFHALEKEMATHSSVLAWRIPGTGEPGRLPAMRSHRVGHDWSDLAAAYLAYSVEFSCSVISDSLQPYGLQHARLPCPSPNSGAYSNSCALSQWCPPSISSSVLPFSSHLQSFPASGPFPVS